MSVLPMPNTDTSSSLPILVIDKDGRLGERLIQKLQETNLVIFVSGKEVEASKNLIHVAFKQKIPKIPDNTFSHIILFYQGEKELREAVPAFITKAKETNSRLTLITDIFHYKEQLSQKLFSVYNNTQVLVMGDVFSEDFTQESPVTALLMEAKMTGKVALLNNGLNLLYPVFIKDVIEGIMVVLFSDNNVQKAYLLFPKHPITALSFVGSLQKVYPLLGIDFRKGKREEKAFVIPEGIFVFGSSYPLNERLKTLDLTHTPLHKKESKKVAYKPNKKKRPVFLFLSLIFFVLSLPLLSSVGLAVGGGALLLTAQNQLSQGEVSKAKHTAQAASSLLSVADQSAITLRTLVSVFGLQQEVLGFQSTIHTGRVLSGALVQGLGGIEAIQNTLDGNTTNAKAEFSQGLGMLKDSVRTVQKLQAEGEIPESYRVRLMELEEPFVLFLNTADSYPALLGFDKAKTYLVLFQNNYELRPTGGFIGSYGILKMERGRVNTFTVNDVYDADGKLKAHIEPPFPYQRYMGATHWFLRDSNYAIDFPTSAANAASFLEMETGQKVDGVIALDVSFLSSILSATGPLRVPDYKETLTPENFFLTTEKHVEENFFPGSTQKKDYLRSVQKALVTKLENGKLNYQKLLTVVLKGVREKHVLFAFSDASEQRLFTLNGLSGSLTDLRESKANRFLDTVGINEANIGLNKSNYYLKREIEHKVNIDGEGKVSGEVMINYQNTSQKNDPFSGDYKAYLRFLLSRGALLREIQLDGVVQATPLAIVRSQDYKATNFRPPLGVEVERVAGETATLYGMFMTVPSGKSKSVTLVYDLPQQVPVNAATFSYDLLILKQPGTLQDPYKLTLSYPVATRLLQSSFPVSDVGSKLIFETTLSEDRRLDLTFTQR